MGDEREEQIVAQIPHLRRYALALLGERAAADDLVQDCLERAWSRLGQWRRSGSLRAWLFSIMHNLFINEAARARGRPTMVALGDDLPEPAVTGNQESQVVVSDLARAIQLLPPEQRAVLILVAVEEMKYDEVAEVLGIPLGTVMSRLHRGRERLARLWNEAHRPELRRIK